MSDVDRSHACWAVFFNAVPAFTPEGKFLLYSRRATVADAAFRQWQIEAAASTIAVITPQDQEAPP